MAISRRQFFRGLTGQGQDPQRRIADVKAYVRTNLLPYDFALTPEQTDDTLETAVAGINVDSDGELLTNERRNRLREIVEARVQLYREEYLKAEDARREAILFVQEFLALEASPEDVKKLGDRFDTPPSASLNEGIEREIRTWLAGLPNSRLADCDSGALRELVFSELRSWC
jgi:uncharacterized membrane protein